VEKGGRREEEVMRSSIIAVFKVAALRLRSHVSGAISFDQVGDAVSPDRSNAGRIIIVR